MDDATLTALLRLIEAAEEALYQQTKLAANDVIDFKGPNGSLRINVNDDSDFGKLISATAYLQSAWEVLTGKKWKERNDERCNN